MSVKVNETAVISPQNLIDSIRVIHPIEQVFVRGRIVGQIRYYDASNPPTIYADLALDNKKIQITCPRNCSPNEGDNIIFSGVLIVKPDPNQFGNLRITVKGEPVGRWTPSDFGDSKVKPERKHSITSLKKLLEYNGLQSLKIIGSKRAIQDLKTEMGKLCQLDDLIDSVECTVTNKKALLNEFRNAAKSTKYKAVLFTRGGADGSIGDVWDDHRFVKDLLDEKFPFFTGIGHSDVITLAEKLADKSFATPTAAGAELGNTIKELKEIQLTNLSKQNAINERDEERQKIAVLETELKQRKTKSSMLIIFLIVALIALVGLIIAVVLK